MNSLLVLVLTQGFALIGELNEDGFLCRLKRPFRIDTVHVQVQGPRGTQVTSQRQVQPPFGLLSIDELALPYGALVLPLANLSDTERRQLEREYEVCADFVAKARARQAGLVVQ